MVEAKQVFSDKYDSTKKTEFIDFYFFAFFSAFREEIDP